LPKKRQAAAVFAGAVALDQQRILRFDDLDRIVRKIDDGRAAASLGAIGAFAQGLKRGGAPPILAPNNFAAVTTADFSPMIAVRSA